MPIAISLAQDAEPRTTQQPAGAPSHAADAYSLGMCWRSGCRLHHYADGPQEYQGRCLTLGLRLIIVVMFRSILQWLIMISNG